MVTGVELSEILSALFVVELLDVGVEPDVLAADGRCSLGLERNLLHGVLLRHDVSARASSFDVELREVIFVDELLQLRLRLEIDLHRLCLAVRIDRKPLNQGTRSALRDVIVLVTGNRSERKPLRVADRSFSITVNHIVNRPLIATVKQPHIEEILPYIDLLPDLHHLVLAVLHNHDKFGHIRAVADELRILVLLQPDSHESLGTVGVEFRIVVHDLSRGDALESCDFRMPRPVLAVFLLEVAEPPYSVFREVFEIVAYLVHLVLDAPDLFVNRLRVEL